MNADPASLPDTARAKRFHDAERQQRHSSSRKRHCRPSRPGESLVLVHAAGINPSNVPAVAGRFGPELPTAPGCDLAGVVVSGPQAGEEVWGSGAGSAPGAGAGRSGPGRPRTGR
jgi:NADPH:quinone reductase-like Zn-dependent oxidoreductase